MDIDSVNNTITTTPNSSNIADAQISVGEVTNQTTFDEFYPEDLVVTFNADSANPSNVKNFTITEKSTGRVIQPYENQAYIPGDDITVEGVSFSLSGQPASGIAATPATLGWKTENVADYATDETGTSFTLQVGSRVETFTIQNNLTGELDFVDNISNPLTDAANAQKLANLGITVSAGSPPVFNAANGENIVVDPQGNSSPVLLTALGLPSGTVSVDGVPAEAGDHFLVESSNKQDIITTLQRFSDAMRAVDGSSEATQTMAEVAASTIGNLNASISHITEFQSDIGARLNVLLSSEERHLDAELLSQSVLSDLQDLDYAEAATRLQLEQFVLQATQQTFVQISNLSLFNLIR